VESVAFKMDGIVLEPRMPIRHGSIWLARETRGSTFILYLSLACPSRQPRVVKVKSDKTSLPLLVTSLNS
jgi:hypothetical protein